MISPALLSWSFEPGLIVSLAALVWVYLRGRRDLAIDLPERYPTWRAVAFVAGAVTLYVALASPLDAFAGLLLQVHMTQHLLLMLVAPPLLWLGAPQLPLLRGLPDVVRRDGLSPFLAWHGLHRVVDVLTHPLVGWIAFVTTMWAWHVPWLYEAAIADPFLHEIEHFSFFFAALLFWFPVVQPYPSRPRWSRWAMVPYLVLADLQSTLFAALLAFSDRVLYPLYERAPRLGGIGALEDQATAAAIMWVPGSIALLVPVVLIVRRLLAAELVRPGEAPVHVAASRVRRERRPIDLLRWPVVGALLPRRGFRFAMQSVLLALAVLVVLDGFLGPEAGAMNVAGVLPWTYGRAFAVIGLLVAGNVFCFACPFMLPRSLARRFLPAGRAWPRALRTKWTAVVLFALFLWAYEVFAVWDSPWWTAWIVVGYFAAALVVDGFFRGASFCKFVCPIGQFDFVASLVSPLEVRARRTDVCGSCTTSDCIRGNERSRGCELDLFLPAKVGNLDCTACLDCVRACPHDNVGIFARMPAAELVADPPRASVGRLGTRLDVAAFASILVFGAFANAAGMVQPVLAAERAIAADLGLGSTLVPTTVLLVLGLVAGPVVVAAGSAWLGTRFAGIGIDGRTFFCRLALALVPLGVAMWAAHLLGHLVMGLASVLPVGMRGLADLGFAGVGAPDWSLAHVMPGSTETLTTVQIVLLDLGLLVSLYLGWRVARQHASRAAIAARALAPWSVVASALFVVGVWVLFQPMEMRGMLLPG